MSETEGGSPSQDENRQVLSLSTHAKTVHEKKAQPKVSKKNEKPAPTSIYEFLTEVFKGRKILKDDRELVMKFQDTLTEEKKHQVLELAEANDKDLRTTLALAEFTLEGAGCSRNKEQILSVVEYIVSNQGSLKSVTSNSIFQKWLDNSNDYTDKLSFFGGQISRIEEADAKSRVKVIKDSKKNNILCIAAIWLYFKKAADFSSLIGHLSRNAFDLKGEAGDQVESGAFGFAASMITSNKKQKFAYLLKRFSSVEEALHSELRRKDLEIGGLFSQLTAKRDEVKRLQEIAHDQGVSIERLKSKIDVQTAEISKRDEAATHTNIHHEDSKEEIKVSLARLLEKDISTLVEKARVANSRTPPKTTVIDYQLNEVLELIEKELKWLRS
jgi:hypothetical protein